MKRLTLDETWVLCLKMWKWIAKEVRVAIKAEKEWNVDNLKAKWLRKHGFNPDKVEQECFFCEWGVLKEGRARTWYRYCPHCPAVKVDSDFGCSEPEYAHTERPTLFYKKLLALNKLRLAKKKKG